MISSDKVIPSEAPAGAPKRFLIAIARWTPRRLILSMWVCVLAGQALAAFRPTSGLGTALGFTIFCGYPYALILGMPDGVIRKGIVAATWKLFAAFCLLWVLMVLAIPFLPNGYSTPIPLAAPIEWMEVVFAVAVNVVVFGPFFLGAAALNDVRHAMKQPTVLDSIPNFLTLFFGMFGGLLFAHRAIRQFFRFEPRPAVDSLP